MLDPGDASDGVTPPMPTPVRVPYKIRSRT